jgi:hypothetical protein
VDPGERRDEILLMTKAVARDVRQYDIDLHSAGLLAKKV